MLRGFVRQTDREAREQRERWEQTLMMVNIQLEPKDRLTYDSLIKQSENGTSKAEERNQKMAEAEAHLRKVFGKKFDAV